MGFLKVIDNPMNVFTFAMPIGNKAPNPRGTYYSLNQIL